MLYSVSISKRTAPKISAPTENLKLKKNTQGFQLNYFTHKILNGTDGCVIAQKYHFYFITC